MLFDSLAPEYGPRQGPGYRSREEMHLLKTVLQDSINLLEQVGQSPVSWECTALSNLAMIVETLLLCLGFECVTSCLSFCTCKCYN